MLRIGKNPKDSAEPEIRTERSDAPPFSAPRTYTPQPAPDVRSDVRSQIEHPAPAMRATTESENLAREIKEGNLSGFVGSGTVVTGEANFKALMRVDGHLSGRITSNSGTLIVGANGKVDANIEVAVATIHGTVNGDIIASQRLELGRAAKLNGNIQTASLVIEPGALFEGTCKMIKMMTAATGKSKSNGRVVESEEAAASNAVEADAPEISSLSSVAS
ncbi:MAG TPA: polymer-forming cytoskeletal protein [Pyrinomonadaceae bacterium]|nr:polymer-forming cytoskeletal protein [Pyrinomonadaceae bacterium]